MTQTTKRMIRLGLAGMAAALLALVAAGCGSDSDPTPTGSAAQPPRTAASESPKKLPAALAANRAEANQILEEGTLSAKLESLRGQPVVVNQWASWCEPCRAEFPFFQASAEAHAADIAFVGIDMQDEPSAAAAFLAELPVPYPSISDPDASPRSARSAVESFRRRRYSSTSRVRSSRSFRAPTHPWSSSRRTSSRTC